MVLSGVGGCSGLQKLVFCFELEAFTVCSLPEKATILSLKICSKVILHVSAYTFPDIKGNQMNLQDVPMDCGYSARKGKDGKIYLRLQLHMRCHMSVQASIVSDFTLGTWPFHNQAMFNLILDCFFLFFFQKGKLYNITIVYTTESGRQEAQLFCPVLIPGSEKGGWFLCVHLWKAIPFAKWCFLLAI